MTDRAKCNSPVPSSSMLEAETRHNIPKARILLDEMGAYLCFARDRIEDTAYRLPVSAGREEMLEFKQPYDVATEMWQVLSEVKVQLDESIERVEAAARVTIEELAAEFPELAAARAESPREAPSPSRSGGSGRVGAPAAWFRPALRSTVCPMSELDEQIRHRREKRDALAEAGISPYPTRFAADLEPADVHAAWGEKSAEELDAATVRLKVPGRVTAIRRHGKLVFVDLSDGRGKIQLFIRTNKLEEPGATILENLDLGDILGAEGTVMRTRLGELSLMTEELTLLSKALRPLPEKWHGLTDVEARYRQRYLDLAVNPEVRRVFEVRAALVRGIRRFLDDKGFLEVETPMMHSIPGGATARPFRTHHHALDLELFLRIAPELFLKRLLVGGIPRVYEINRNFRNEGISFKHNPEFTMLEFYWAYADYRDMMDLTEEILPRLADEVLGTRKLSWQGTEIDLTPPWPRLTMRRALTELAGVEETATESADGLRAEMGRRGIEPPPDSSYGKLLAHLFEELVEERLIQPTFLLDHPVEVSPLAKQSAEDPRFTERFELYVGGMEIANAFSELNDPDVQAERFHQQIAAREAGDEEAHLYDADYVRALEHGMPPAGGEGIGIDRLVMLFTGMESIRDVILFPLLRPEEPKGDHLGEGAEGDSEEPAV